MNLEKKFGEGREAEGRLEGGGHWGQEEDIGAREDRNSSFSPYRHGSFGHK